MGNIVSKKKPETLQSLLNEILSSQYSADIIDSIVSYIPQNEWKLVYPKPPELQYCNSHLVSIYEAGEHATGPGHTHPIWPCYIWIIDPFPKALFLSSHEPVNWVIVGPFPCSVQAIWIMSYYECEVSCACPHTKIHYYTYYPADQQDYDSMRENRPLRNEWQGPAGSRKTYELKQCCQAIKETKGCRIISAQSRYYKTWFCVHWIWLIVYMAIVIACLVLNGQGII
eukprot:157524_1